MMANMLLVARRELLSLLVSPFSYVIAAAFFTVNGLFFWLFVGHPDLRGNFELIVQLFFSWWGFWFFAIFIPPLVTMKLLADEFRLGTIEMLMTAPSSDASVVLGKYLASVAYAVALWAPTLLFFAISAGHGGSFDWGVVGSGYLAAILVYALFMAIGLFTSALTETPILSAFLAIVIEVALFFMIFLKDWLRGSAIAGWIGGTEVVDTLSDRYAIYNVVSETFMKGVVDSVHLVFFLSFAGLFLFGATRSLEFRRWR